MPEPFVTAKMMLVPLRGAPFARALAINGILTFAPCATCAVCGAKAKSSANDRTASVVWTCLADGYEAGASCAVMVATPAASGVTNVVACPSWSVTAEQGETFGQAEKLAVNVELKTTVAPATGVMPSAAKACTVIGFGACPPSGVHGLEPAIKLIVSPGPAP